MESYIFQLAQDCGALLAGAAILWFVGYLITDAIINKDQ